MSLRDNQRNTAISSATNRINTFVHAHSIITHGVWVYIFKKTAFLLGICLENYMILTATYNAKIDTISCVLIDFGLSNSCPNEMASFNQTLLEQPGVIEHCQTLYQAYILSAFSFSLILSVNE